MVSTWDVPAEHTHTRYLRDANGSLAEQLSTQEFHADSIPDGYTEIDEATYWAELQILEDAIEDHVRDTLHAESVQRATDHAALLKAKIPADVAASLTGHDEAAHTALMAAGPEDQYVDPKRRTVRADARAV